MLSRSVAWVCTTVQGCPCACGLPSNQQWGCAGQVVAGRPLMGRIKSVGGLLKLPLPGDLHNQPSPVQQNTKIVPLRSISIMLLQATVVLSPDFPLLHLWHWNRCRHVVICPPPISLFLVFWKPLGPPPCFSLCMVRIHCSLFMEDASSLQVHADPPLHKHPLSFSLINSHQHILLFFVFLQKGGGGGKQCRGILLQYSSY